MQNINNSMVNIKIGVIGQLNAGKTSIVKRYINKCFPNLEDQKNTIGLDFQFCKITLFEKNFLLEVYDTAGQQRFRSLITSYLKSSNFIMVVFDASKHTQTILSHLKYWFQFLMNIYSNNLDQKEVIIVGNKLDLIKKEEKELKLKQVQNATKKYQQQHNCPLLFSSAKTGENIEQIFMNAVRRIYDKTSKLEQEMSAQEKRQNLILNQEQRPRIWCCW